MKDKFKMGCRYFIGEKPCIYRRENCLDCERYSAKGTKILIIKLSAKGDVLRTTPLLYGLKERYPDSYIIWVTDSESLDLIKHNNYIDKILSLDLETALRLRIETFDIAICLDKEVRATALISSVFAKNKFGFGFNPNGNIYPLNKESDYMFEIGTNDELKFRGNKKSYQEIIFEAVGLPFRGQRYILKYSEKEKRVAEEFFRNKGISANDMVIGLNTGAGLGFPTKAWNIENYVQLADKIVTKMGTKVILIGGPLEREKNRKIVELVKVPIIDAGCNNTLLEFAALIAKSDLVVSPDSLGMHLAIALERTVVALFGPTSHQEIDLYNKGAKIISRKECSPCYLKECVKNPSCMDEISADEVFETIKNLLNKRNR